MEENFKRIAIFYRPWFPHFSSNAEAFATYTDRLFAVAEKMREISKLISEDCFHQLEYGDYIFIDCPEEVANILIEKGLAELASDII